MKYAKLIDGALHFAPNPISVGTERFGNPPDSLYLAQGFKPLTETPCPDASEPGFCWLLQWTEKTDCISQSWVLQPLPPEEELSSQEALQILLGGEAE